MAKKITKSKLARSIAAKAKITAKEAGHLVIILEKLVKTKAKTSLVIPGVGKVVFERQQSRSKPAPRSKTEVPKGKRRPGIESGSDPAQPVAVAPIEEDVEIQAEAFDLLEDINEDEASADPGTHGPGEGRPW